MPHVTFTEHISRHVPCPPRDVAGLTLREALDAYLQIEPQVRTYVFDEQGMLRKHVVVFVDGYQAVDRSGLSDGVTQQSVIRVMQALSGG
jgi:hypothetical protein